MYFAEFRQNWAPLLGASLGMGVGAALGFYALGVFGPALIAEFGWSRAQFALVGVLPLATMAVTPLGGWFADRFGVRLAALLGYCAIALGFLAFAGMSGRVNEFFAIWIAQNVFAILTSALVLCRVIVERFDKARGMALALATCAPPLVGAIAAPLVGAMIEAHGWRAAYLALAAVTVLGGAAAILLIGKPLARAVSTEAAPAPGRGSLLGVLRSPVLWLLVGGMFLVNIPQGFASSQLKLVVMDRGVASETATWMISIYAIGVIAGRLICGLALDRIAAHVVAAVALSLPVLGYLGFAAHLNGIAVLAACVALIGLAQGAEGDLGAYLVSRRFGVGNFSFLLSLLSAMIGAGGAIGSLLLSVTLARTDGYDWFLWAAAVATLLGAGMFGLTGLAKLRSGADRTTA
jgi:MFS family permease